MMVSDGRVAARTHVGLVRDGNEDAYGVDEDAWAVADGLGGHAGGEIASGIAVDSALRTLRGADTTDMVSALRSAFRAADADIHIRAEAETALADMATTLVVAVRDAAGDVCVGNLGDSRAYVVTAGELRQVTRDDNVAEVLLERGALTAEQARVHPGQFQLTKALGLGDWEPAIHRLEPATGRLLLCSDGANGELPDDQIAQLLGSGSPQEACERLVAAALEAGGSDNVTVLIVDL